jgi:hypothetical protein
VCSALFKACSMDHGRQSAITGSTERQQARCSISNLLVDDGIDEAF